MIKINWKNFAPWFLTVACTIMLLVIGVFLIKNINWYKESVFSKEVSDINTPNYRFYAYHLHLSMIKRSIGLFSGFAIMFLGLGVAFYTLKDNSTMSLESTGLTTKIVTASPGLIAMITGAYLITSSISSKDTFPAYSGNAVSQEAPMDSTKTPTIPNF